MTKNYLGIGYLWPRLRLYILAKTSNALSEIRATYLRVVCSQLEVGGGPRLRFLGVRKAVVLLQGMGGDERQLLPNSDKPYVQRNAFF